MANSFYRSYWNPNFLHGYYPQGNHIHPRASKGPKSVSIPVHFVASDGGAGLKQSLHLSSGAIKIQKAVRGFLVRKNVRVIRQVAAEVDEVERKVREEEEEIRSNAKKRIWVSETLMALLLRLDSVRGVRDFRKSVIRRVISLQEAIDSFHTADTAADDMQEDSKSLRGEASEESSTFYTDQTTLVPKEENTEFAAQIRNEVESTKTNFNPMTASEGGGITSVNTAKEERDVSGKKSADDASENSNETETALKMATQATVEPSDNEVTGDDQALELEEEKNHANAEQEVEDLEILESPKRKIDLKDIAIGKELGSRSQEDEEEGSSMVVETWDEKREGGREMREMMERMAAENQRLKGMVAQLCAANSEQCRLMETVVHRVEQLERDVHRMERRRKKRRTGASRSALPSAK